MFAAVFSVNLSVQTEAKESLSSTEAVESNEFKEPELSSGLPEVYTREDGYLNISNDFEILRMDNNSSVTGESLKLIKGQSLHLRKLIYSKTLKADDMAFYSSNPDFITIDQDGFLKAARVGESVITLLSSTGERTEFSVNVMPVEGTYTTKPDPDWKGEVYVGRQKVYYGKSPEKMISFTFDDGPGPATPALLDMLKKYDAHATFFVVGRNAKNKKAILERMIKEGHIIGNHTYSHPSPSNKIETELSSIGNCSSIVKELTGQSPAYFRPPFAKRTDALKAASVQLNLPLILWSLDTRDWAQKEWKPVYDKIKGEAKPNDVVLMHDLHGSAEYTAEIVTLPAVEKILAEFTEQGYTFVTVDELYARRGKVLKAGVSY
jgi:peptidoglycan/xylan/chitin deacetylase (PgdA/CDA1 family)